MENCDVLAHPLNRVALGFGRRKGAKGVLLSLEVGLGVGLVWFPSLNPPPSQHFDVGKFMDPFLGGVGHCGLVQVVRNRYLPMLRGVFGPVPFIFGLHRLFHGPELGGVQLLPLSFVPKDPVHPQRSELFIDRLEREEVKDGKGNLLVESSQFDQASDVRKVTVADGNYQVGVVGNELPEDKPVV